MTENKVAVEQCDRDALDAIWIANMRAAGRGEKADDACLQILARHRTRTLEASQPQEAEGEDFLVARVSEDTRVIGIDHPTEADWTAVRRAHIALRDRINERLRYQDLCPFSPLLEEIRGVLPPPLANDYAYGKGWNDARGRTKERIEALLAKAGKPQEASQEEKQIIYSSMAHDFEKRGPLSTPPIQAAESGKVQEISK